MFGDGTPYRGQVYVHGEPIRIINTSDAVEKGLAYLPLNRKENGIIKDMSVLENASVVIWPYISKLGFINTVAQTSFFDSQVKKLQIKLAHRNNLITSLSGGNQQKVCPAQSGLRVGHRRAAPGARGLGRHGHARSYFAGAL